jgi:hypothetical protein
MLDTGFVPLADLLTTLNEFAVVTLVGAFLLVLWELAILLGSMIGSLKDRRQRDDGGRARV